MPRVDRESRRVRDALILRLFLAGNSYRQIARAPGVNLSHRTVGDVVQRAIADRSGQGVFAGQARGMFLMRSEALLRTAMPKALAGDIDAVNACTRILGQQARVRGLIDG